MAGQETPQPAAPPQRVGVREFRSNFSGFINRVRQGSSFEVTWRDTVVAVVRPPEPPAPPLRRPGAMRGRIVMAADFDDASGELIATMEGGEE